MDRSSVKNLGDAALFSTVKELRKKECRVMADMILHLAEIDERGIYRDAGFSSLFTYMTHELRYSEGAASRRLRAVRCLRESSEIYELLRTGKLSLCALSEIQPVLNDTNRATVLKETQGCSKQQANRLAAKYGAPRKSKASSIKAKKIIVSSSAAMPLFEMVMTNPETKEEERFSFSFEVTPEIKALYDEARAQMGPYDVAKVFERLLRSFLKKKNGRPETASKGKPSPKGASASKPAKRSRHIPLSVRRKVRIRDKGQCVFVGKDGNRCQEKVGLQFQHIQPFAAGGTNDEGNICLYCAAHNELAAEWWYGKEKMEQARQKQRIERKLSRNSAGGGKF